MPLRRGGGGEWDMSAKVSRETGSVTMAGFTPGPVITEAQH